MTRDSDEALARIEQFERRRRARPFTDPLITLSHGSGGRAMHHLIQAVFIEALRNPVLEALGDHALLEIGGARLAFTTDAYVVDPIFFPGGDIGRLAVNGTINDLATSGACPVALSLAVILEEGFPVDDLRRVTDSIADAARRAGVPIVTGDTKVVPRGKADRIFITTTGIGSVAPELDLSPAHIHSGDRVLVSGPIGDHGVTVLAARGQLELQTSITSDTAPLHELVQSILAASDGVRCMRDPTRGGVATTLNELAQQAGLCVEIQDTDLPVRAEVRGACEILGLDPLYIANEGKLVVVCADHAAGAVLEAMQRHELGRNAAVIGQVLSEPPGRVLLRTAFGGTRVLDMLTGEPLPRIC